jgi:hypothetical protein
MTITIKDRIEAKEYEGYGDPEDILNLCDVELMKLPPVECPLTHRFTPGMYIREIFMPKGSIVTSLLHLTTHPFFIMKGDVNVYYPGLPVERYIAPYTGVTKAGTRRLLFNNEDTVWITCHITDLTDPDEIMESITSNDFNPLIDNTNPRVNTWRNNLQPSLPQ